MTKKYIGLTIGPLYKTMSRVRATRELWASSYIFSYIMKKMIEKLKDGREFVLPYTGDEDVFKEGREVGLFHDRFIFKANNGDFENVKKIKDKVLRELATGMSKIIKENDLTKIYNFLDRYFQIYYCEVEVEGDFKEANRVVNKYLDSLELQKKFIQKEDEDYIAEFFDIVNKSFFIEDAFEKKQHRFPSIPEIAALYYESEKDKKDLDWTGIKLKYKKKKVNDKEVDTNDTDDTDIYAQLRKVNGDKFKQYHKYIAIVQADGDSVSDTIKSLNNNDDFGKLSRALLEFSKEAHKMIKDYGGTTIFAGGDDLLFFAPVVCKGENIFQLVDKLAKEFACKFKEFDQTPTLSTGISITYYKHPMGEALESATHLLLEKAKDKKIGKNAIAYEVQKHSGQRIAGVFRRCDNDYKEFTKLIFDKADQKMLSSLIHKLAFHGSLIDEIADDKLKIDNYFRNFFNEEVHKQYQNIIDSTANLIQAIYSNHKQEKKKELIFSVLRLKKFLEGGE